MTSSVSWWLATARWTRKLASAAIAAVCCVSCINEYPADTEDLFRTRSVDLALQISLLEDADKEGEALPPMEKMHDLRVIITRMENGKEYVEYNRYIDFGTQREYRYGYLRDNRLVFRVTAPETKHIYLFANSEPLFAGIEHVDPEHGNYGVRHPKPQGAAEKAPGEYDAIEASEYINQLRELTFTQDQLNEFVKDEKANGIPMSAEYDVKVTPGNTGISDFCVFEAWIVRACNKITFEYENYRLQYPIFVQNWALNLVAKDAYLLPRVPADDEKNKSLFGAGTKYKGDWIAWYSDHIWDGVHADELNFEVPLTTNYNSYNGRSDGKETYADLSVTEVKPDGSDDMVFIECVTGLKVGNLYWNMEGAGIPGKTTDEVVYYFPETRNRTYGSDAQEYTMSFKTLEYNASASGSEGHHWVDSHSYKSGPMENVSTLFRNTHVQIRATFMESDQVGLNVSIINWDVNDAVDGNLTPEIRPDGMAETERNREK